MFDRPRSRAAIVVVSVVAALLALGGCSTEPIQTDASKTAELNAALRTGPTTAVLRDPDIIPVEVNPTASARAARIVAMDRNGTLGSIVFALGLGKNMVGRDRSTKFPSALKVPVVTETGHSINTERVLDVNPTIVLVGEDANPAGSITALRSAGLTVVPFTPERSVETNSALIRSVAAALGAHDAGEKLIIRTEAQVNTASERIPALPARPRIAFLYIRGEHLILLAGPKSGADNLIEHLGGVDVGTDIGLDAAFTTVSPEIMMDANPDVILVMTQGAESLGGMDKLLELPAVALTSAGKAKRIVAMDETQILAFGPDTGNVLGTLTSAIYA